MQGLNRVWRSAVTESTAWLGGLLWHIRQAPIPACPVRLQAERSPWLCPWALVQPWLCLQGCKAHDLQLALGLDFPTTVGEALSGLFCSVSAQMCTSLFFPLFSSLRPFLSLSLTEQTRHCSLVLSTVC